jgi:hypothetical protein
MKELVMASFDILGYHLIETKAGLAADLLSVDVRNTFFTVPLGR